MTTFVPAEPFPPGGYLSDELEARGWTHEDLSDVTGISRRQIINIIQGKSGVTAETARAIGAAFGQDPVTWMNLQVAYELALANKEQRDVEKRARIYSMVPVRELVRRCWIPKTKTVDELEDAVCRFFSISTIDDAPDINIAARKSSDYSFTSPSQMSWYYRVRQLGEVAPVGANYRDGDWDDGVKELKKLAAYAEDARRVPAVLAEIGIRLVVVQHLRGTKTDGVATWLDESSPVIGLSLRYNRMDNFWFSLFHELVHLKHRDSSPVDEDILFDNSDRPKMEVVADTEAAEALIPKDKLDSFIARCGPLYYTSRVVQFAQSVKVHPAIVVGQLQYRKEVKYSQFTKLKEKVADHIRGQAITDGWGDVVTLE